jgi:putative endonuclease
MSAPTDDRVALGRRGEDLAMRFLRGRGHRVLAHRFRVRHGELDLVTRSGEHLYFVEVKTRRPGSRRFGGALGSLDGLKLRRMTRVAEVFVARRNLFDLQPHFALLTVEESGDRRRVSFLPDVFDAC